MRRSTILAVVAVAAIALPVGSASAVPMQGARPAPAVEVPLITGDTVAITPGLRPHVVTSLRTHHGIAGQVSTFSAGKDIYVLPGAARRYVGTILDPSLFNVTARARSGAPARLAVTIRLARGARPHVPGLTVTSRSASGERGYLTARGRQAFGIALARQWRADARNRRTPRTIFGGVNRIAAPGATAAMPRYQQYTLVIHVTDPAGRPADYAFVSLTNVDDGRKFSNFIQVIHGLAKVSVPAGNYSGLAEYDAFRRTGVIAAYLVPLEQVAVTHNNAQMLFDMRTATAKPSVQTPRPAAMQSETLEWDRDTKSFAISYSTAFGPDSIVRVAPSAPATEGQLHWLTTWQLSATPTSGAPYSYDLVFDDEGQVQADQRHAISPSDLAQVNARYYTDQQARLAYFGRGPFFPFQFFSSTELLSLQTPTARTEYVNDPGGALWTAVLVAAATDFDPFQGLVFDGARSYVPGATYSADWLRGPLAPGMQQPTAGFGFGCGYCRNPKSMGLFFNPVADSDPGHGGTFDVPDRRFVAAHFTLYRNGVRVKNEPNSTGDVVRVPQGTAVYRAVVRTEREAVGFATSTSASLSVTFVSSAISGSSAPPRWFCVGAHKTCTVLPLLSAVVPLPTDLDGTMPLGATPVTFEVRHVTGAADSAIGKVSFALTADGGRSYHKLPVTSLGGDHYQVTIDNPQTWANRGIGIRIRAADSAGGALTETVQNAYYVAQS
jgi:hypothetical protein